MNGGVLLVQYLLAVLCTSLSVVEGQEPRVYITKPTYKVTKYIGDATVGSTVISIPVTAEPENVFATKLAHFSVNAFFSDNFAIGRRSGAVTIVRPVRTTRYNLQVTCLFDVTLTDGTKFQNTSRATVEVIFNEGVSFKKPLYTVEVDVDVPDRSVILDLSDEDQVDRTIVSDLSLRTFARTSRRGFGVKPNGRVFVETTLEPRRTYSFSVFLTYEGLDYKGRAIEGEAAANVHVVTQGCPREDGGSHTWPIIHPCGVATANCTEYDDAFDNYGVVRRVCTSEGYWLSPDFSQCRLKEDADSFAIVWFTFRTTRTSASRTRQTITELKGIFDEFPVNSIDFHHVKRSTVVFGTAESFRVSFNLTGAPSNATLSKAWKAINGTRTFARWTISKSNTSFGVLGFTPADRCVSFDHNMAPFQFQSVCQLSGEGSCNCQSESPFQPGPCCTAEGKVDTSNKTCLAQPPSFVACTLSSRSSVTAKMYPTSRSIYVDWEFTAIPDHVIVTYTSKEDQGQKEFAGGEREADGRVYGLLPSTIYTVSVRGECANDPSVPPIITTSLLQTKDEDHPIAPFQLRFKTALDCDDLKTLVDWGAVQDSLVSLLSHGCLCTFNTDRISGLRVECPSQSYAILRGWIYGEGADPATNYIALLQQSVDSKASFTLGQQKLTLDPTCPAAVATPSSPSCGASNLTPQTAPQTGVAAPSASNNASVAGTVVGVIIGLIVCVLLGLILVVLVLKYRRGSMMTGVPAATVVFTEADKPKEDEEKLQEDF